MFNLMALHLNHLWFGYLLLNCYYESALGLEVRIVTNSTKLLFELIFPVRETNSTPNTLYFYK